MGKFNEEKYRKNLAWEMTGIEEHNISMDMEKTACDGLTLSENGVHKKRNIGLELPAFIDDDYYSESAEPIEFDFERELYSFDSNGINWYFRNIFNSDGTFTPEMAPFWTKEEAFKRLNAETSNKKILKKKNK